MKLPFSFGINLLFRLVFPGIVLALVLAPGIEALLRWSDNQVEPLAYVPAVAVLLGWLLSLCDMPIYMIYEGRRFWPQPLLRRGIRREQRRLERLQRKADEALDQGDRGRYVELSIQIAQFPLDERGERHATMPTRLGNLICEYELYPRQKYGLDSVFFFYRIWVTIPEDLREEIDGKQAAVDGALYTACVLLLAAPVFAIYATSRALWRPRALDRHAGALRDLRRPRPPDLARGLPAVPVRARAVRRVLQGAVRSARLEAGLQGAAGVLGRRDRRPGAQLARGERSQHGRLALPALAQGAPQREGPERELRGRGPHSAEPGAADRGAGARG